jgi:hypothetical protein
MGLTDDSAQHLRALVNTPGLSDEELLARSLRLCALWRSKLWANTLATTDTRIRSGPFAGMNYVVNSAEGALLPRLLGTYERELHAHIYALAHEGVERIVDIGCAEGYYAVGLARLMPQAVVHAYDIDETARRRCAILARENGVADRVMVHDRFTGADFARYSDHKTLFFIDAEGFEDELLRPDLYPTLDRVAMIVETHPMYKPAITDRLCERFETTHHILRVEPQVLAADIDPLISRRSHLDLTLSTWEWRAGPTPWLVLRPRRGWDTRNA